MRAVVFCDSLGRIGDYRRAFAGSNHVLGFVVCARRARLGVLRQLVYMARRFGPADWLAFASALAGRRIGWRGRDPHDAATFGFLDRFRPDLALHAMGTIYRAPVIERCGRGILNAHIGELPLHRGRSVMEWSLLRGARTGVTVFFIDEGIDTGSPVVLFRPVAVDHIADLDAAKRFLFDHDATLYREAIDRIAADEPPMANDTREGLRFYEMSTLFRACLQTQRDAAA